MEENLWSLVSRTIEKSGSIEKAVFVLLAVFSLISWKRWELMLPPMTALST